MQDGSSSGIARGGRSTLRRYATSKWVLGSVAALGAVAAFVVTSSAAPTIPVPELIAIVHTESNGVVKDTPIPIGGVPIPIDVDNGTLLGLLCPDIDVSVGLLATDELPGNPLVPNIVVKRDALALLRHAPSPNLKFSVRIVIDDIGNLKKLATIDYGFETPPGARMPHVVTAKLLGPITSGFVDPLKAKLETPGYNGPLQFNIHANTDSFDGKFALKFDPLPEAVKITEDPSESGLDFTYDHVGTPSDVKLDATADLKDAASGDTRHIGASVERLPNHLQLTNTNTPDATSFEYRAGADSGKPDIEATYRDTLSTGVVSTDVDAKISGLPAHMLGTIDTRPGSGGSTDIDGVSFSALDGQKIDAVDFVARNFTGDGGALPNYLNAGPDQVVSVAALRLGNGTSLFRAAGRLQNITNGNFARTGADRGKLDVTSNIGDGVKPLRAILDVDNRTAPPAESPQHLRLDSTVDPLPATIHAQFDPGKGPNPLHLTYDSPTTANVDADALIASGASDACGGDRVICAQARIDHLPPHIDVQLPSGDATDVAISHNGAAQLPDVAATADIGPDLTKTPASPRTWVHAALTSVPQEVRGRLDTTGGTLHAAEFHACAFNFSNQHCDTAKPIGAIGKVSFAVRDQPTRTGLPARPDTSPQFVTLLSRKHASDPSHFEVAGNVSAVRNVVFRQRGDQANGDTGALGALVDIGSGGDPFDVVVDSSEDSLDTGHQPPTVNGTKDESIDVHVAALPRTFSACVRPGSDHAAPTGLPADDLLNKCESSRIAPGAGQQVTPLSAVYTATDAAGDPTPTSIAADVSSTEPDSGDLDAFGNPFPVTTALHAGVTNLPGFLQADVIPNATGRPLKINYTTKPTDSSPAPPANAPATTIDFGLQQRRSTSICADPRPHRKALCVDGVLSNLPANFAALYDPDDAKGDIDFTSTPPVDAAHKLSINPIRISKIGPGAADTPLVVDGSIKGLTPHMKARIQTPEVNGEKTPARLSFDACPDGGSCDGIDEIDVKATSALAGDPLPPVPAADPPIGGPAQEFSYVQSGDDFRAQATVRKLKLLSYSKLEDDGSPSPVTRIATAFGDGSPLRAFLDRETADDTVKADVVVTDAPQTVDLCMRDKVALSELVSSGGDVCKLADVNGDGVTDEGRAVASAQVGSPNDGKTDIDVRNFTLTKANGSDFVSGSLKIDDLAKRIDVLSGDDTVVEGHNVGDAPGADPQDIAGRVTFNLQTFADKGTLTGFPWQSLDGGPDPKDDPANQGNYVQLFQEGDKRIRVQGSVPDIKRVAISPRPCNTDPTLFPTSGFGVDDHQQDLTPSYTCARVAAAAGQPFGLAVRTLDADPNAPLDHNTEVLSVDAGHISAMPDTLAATLAKLPDGDKALPACSASRLSPCRPPMVSLETTHPDNITPRLDARLATGDLNDLTALRPVEPNDPVSARLDYDESPRAGDFPDGVRVRIGTTGAGRSAIRIGAKLALPRFLDIDSPTSFDCTHENVGGGAGCSAGGVGSGVNHGFSSKDIGIGIVAANDKHFGNPEAAHPRLGRVALMVTPLDDLTGGQQIVVTGAPQADNEDPIVHRPTIGAESHSPEDPAPPSDEDKGFDAPAHLDARVFMRNDFFAREQGGDDHKQVSYTQVDGRVNVPLSLTLRLDNLPPSPALGPDALALQNFVPNTNRGGKLVPGVQLELRNAPGSNNADDYAKPTFRVRTELRDDLASETAPDPKKDPQKIFSTNEGFTCNLDEKAVQGLIGAHFCVVVPKEAKARYVDMQLNADPYSDGNRSTTDGENGHTGPARTVDVVGGPFGSDNHVELRGWKDVDGSGGPDGKGDPADLTPVAAVDLRNFNFGLKVGLDALIAGVQVDWDLLGDLQFGLAGHAVSATRVDSTAEKLKLTSEGGEDPNDAARIITNLSESERFQIHADLFFGLATVRLVNIRTPSFHQGVQFNTCGAGNFNTVDEFWTGGNHDDFSTAGPGTSEGSIGLAIPIAPESGTAQVLSILSDIASLVTCRIQDPGKPDLVTASHPAPSYELQAHGVPDTPTPAGPTSGTTPAGDVAPPPVANLDVPAGTSKTLCGGYQFGALTVEGHIEDALSGVDDNGHPCNGSLAITATSINVSSAGSVTANGSSSGTPGAPGGNIGLFGSETLEINGTVSVNGGPGADKPINTGGACQTGGTGGDAGTITVSSNIILGTTNNGRHELEAKGGIGGAGGIGGHGGDGGTVSINDVVDALSADVTHGNGFDPGDGNCGTQDHRKGLNGADGVVNGTHPENISTVDMNSATPGPFLSGKPKVSESAISHLGGRLVITLCRTRVDFNPYAFSDPALDPQGTTAAEIESHATCTDKRFEGPSGAHNTYSDTQTLDLPSGVYGFFTITNTLKCESRLIETKDSNGTITCIDPSNGSTSAPTVKVPSDLLPTKATAKIGVDLEDPSINSAAITNDTVKGLCEAIGQFPNTASDCTSEKQVNLDIDARDENGSGIDHVACLLHNTDTQKPGQDGVFFDCTGNPTLVTLAPGLNRIDVFAVDKAGNSEDSIDTVLVSFDPNTPNVPTIDVSDNDQAVNGWHRVKPSIRVNTADPVPSSGFAANAIHFFVDDVETDCGQNIAGNGAFQELHCEPSDLAASIPDEGVHVLTATVRDRVKHQTDLSAAHTIKVDDRPPSSQFSLNPGAADGKGGFYKSKPFFAITARDLPGGSGMDASEDSANVGTGISVSVDGGAFQRFDPEAPNQLADGEHKVCWFARDVAGNREDADASQPGDQDHCVDHIKVDATAPVATAVVNPAQPDGSNGFYSHRPTFTQSATDAAGGSGLAGVQFQIDDGPWTAATSVTVPEGRHDLRVRAFDVAGNESVVVERSVQVDITIPKASLISFPPLPNGRGWFRQARIDSVAVSDARDSSGPDGATVKLDGGTPSEYSGPFGVGPGTHDVTVRARDRAGLQGTPVNQNSKVDLTAPLGTPSNTAPGPILISILGIFGTTTLNFSVADAGTPKVKTTVLVFNSIGGVVRHLDVTAGTDGAGFRTPGNLSVVWNGRNDAGGGVLPGIYMFRVQVADEAGNTTVSTESPTFLVIQGLLPILGL